MNPTRFLARGLRTTSIKSKGLRVTVWRFASFEREGRNNMNSYAIIQTTLGFLMALIAMLLVVVVEDPETALVVAVVSVTYCLGGVAWAIREK